MTQETTTMPTQEELLAQMQAAMSSGDYKEVAKVAKQIDSLEKDLEKAELEAKQKAVEAVTQKVSDAITKVIQKFIDAGELDEADGVWFTWDFEETLKTCKLMKKAVKTSSGSRKGVGKKYDKPTEDLLAKYGELTAPEGTKLSKQDVGGRTWNELNEAFTDKNSRYGIRKHLIKLDEES